MCDLDPDIMADLQPEILLSAYAQGIFPMVHEGRLLWFSPDPRALMPLDDRFHASRRLWRTLRSGRFGISVSTCFERVIRLCATCGTGREKGSWISEEMIAAYCRLHELGFACSYETWPAERIGQGDPVGGLYGVVLGKAFFGESMFHTVTDAGKIALVTAVAHLRGHEFELFDTQWTTPNLLRYGAYEIPREQYLAMLEKAIAAALEPDGGDAEEDADDGAEG